LTYSWSPHEGKGSTRKKKNRKVVTGGRYAAIFRRALPEEKTGPIRENPRQKKGSRKKKEVREKTKGRKVGGGSYPHLPLGNRRTQEKGVISKIGRGRIAKGDI